MISERIASRAEQRAVRSEYLLPAHPSSIADARRLVRDALVGRAGTDTIDSVELVVSELVTNAVRHGPGEPISLRLATAPDGRVGGEVVDQGHGEVAIREPDGELDFGGRGLRIVEALTSDWGVYPGSTHVWFRIDP